VVTAAGEGLRAGGSVPKQFAPYRGRPLLRHSVAALCRHGIAPVVVTVPPAHTALAASATARLGEVILVSGGATRQASVRLGLEALASLSPERVLIHDAARPRLPQGVVDGLTAALDRHTAAIPVLPVVDSLWREGAGQVPRQHLYRVQTPQAFRYAEILAAHRSWSGPAEACDDAEVARAAGIEVALVEGDEAMRKVTFPADLGAVDLAGPSPPRVGTGYDVHRLAAGEALWLCGVRIEHERGLAGHSDADVAIHAVVDAILGALALGDIGDHFPPSDARWRGAPSARFLSHARDLAAGLGYAVANLDVTIVCEAPRIGPHKPAMRGRLAEILGIDMAAVSVKATTSERLGFTGRGEGIAAQAVAMLMPVDEAGGWIGGR
jgi:2-C-methyl-D-erythritol 4-phosphate cytidylyltransferase/2-C-methyl-D-erythritol 2,4-cyclodiphosphate synthase